MLTFTDGAASGSSFLSHRAPQLLRIVINEAGDIDALTDVSDEPKPGEVCHAYERCRTNPMVQIDRSARHPPPVTGKFPSTIYRSVTPQPGQDVMKDNAKWREWCVERMKTTAAYRRLQTAETGATP